MSKGAFTFLSRQHLNQSNHFNVSRSNFVANEPPRGRVPVCSVCHYGSLSWDARGSRTGCAEHSPLWNDTFRPPLNVAPKLHKRSGSRAYPGPVNITPLAKSSLGAAPGPGCFQKTATVPVWTPSTNRRYPEERQYPAVGRSNKVYNEANKAILLRKVDRNIEALRQCPAATGKAFLTHFPPVNKQREKTKMARDARNIFEGYPYYNHTPHDHRPLSTGRREVITLKTPDPLDLRLKREALLPPEEFGHSAEQDELSYSCSDGKRDSDEKHAATQLTPEPQYRADLYLNKGRYSPAFSGHEAYLDRAVTTVNCRHVLN